LDIQYIGESLIYGKLGYLFSVSAFVSAIIGFIAYFISSQSAHQEKNTWKNLGKIWFSLHTISVVSVIILLFYLLFNHHFEYEYAWKHSDKTLPWYYILSSFWEGQEGSFLLWSFWHIFLAWFVLWKKDKFEASVMIIICAVQAILSSMTLGLYFFGHKMGSSPFILLRESMPQAPIFNKANYLEMISGNGLNPLLQNYWMVIHPPILFLGFAAVTIPFAYTIASLWEKSYKEIAKPLLTWSLWALFILGTGILMGSAWAYEALSFGGYWAWDPVENASFVPWLTLAAGVHTVLIYKHSKHSLKASFSLFIISFFLVLYSTFLTRSGILGDTSVHSFTDLGMSGQLLVLLFALTVPSIILLIYRWRSIPAPRQEEAIQSREFWMFIGALIFTFSAALITFTTSIPVWNYFLKFFKLKELAPPLNVIEHYNKYQIVIAFFLAFGAGFVQFLRYKQNKISNFLQPLIIPTIISLLVSGLIIWGGELYNWSYIVLTVLSCFTFFANAGYIISVLRGNVLASSGSITHIGFGIMLIGILISSAKKEVISFNTMGFDYGKGFSEKDKAENILLAKDLASPMGNYTLTYMKEHVNGVNRNYDIKFEKFDDKKNLVETFIVSPNVQLNPKMGMVSNPSTKHFWNKDIFTQVSSVPDKTKPDNEEAFKTYLVKKGDTIGLNKCFLIFRGLNNNPIKENWTKQANDIAVSAVFKVSNGKDTAFAEPVYYIRDNFAFSIFDTIPKFKLEVRFHKIIPETGQIEIAVKEDTKIKDYVIMKATVFPMIVLFWIGSCLMLFGVLMSLLRRYFERFKEPI